jgi:RimJ/RimL family protein N-acetyltransferase
MLLEAGEQDFVDLIAGNAPRGLALPNSALAPVEVLHILGELATSIRSTFAPAAWMILEQGEIVGLCSITKLVDGGGIDIGYGIAPTRQGQGNATRAVSAILEWARNDSRVQMVTAETAVNNPASQRVLLHNGFTQTGQRYDPEDGDLFSWKIDVARPIQIS